jgi:hypothetical protein
MTFKLTGTNQLHFIHDCEDHEDKLHFIDQLLGKMKLDTKKAV